MVLRQATFFEAAEIWKIIQQAIAQRKKEGSNQWQDGYPNKKSIEDDIKNANAYVMVDQQKIIAYAAIIFGEEPAYNNIKGEWLNHEDYVVVHRVATAKAEKGKGVATQLFMFLEEICIAKNTFSIKIDTNFDNDPMLKILDKLNYSYCGEVMVSGAARLAFQKIISHNSKG